MTEKPRETQAESHVVELKEKVNNSSLMKHLNLEDGILRARFRNSREREELMEPGTVYRIEIDCGLRPTASPRVTGSDWIFPAVTFPSTMSIPTPARDWVRTPT